MSVDLARPLALDVLRAVDTSGAYANLELGRLARERRLNARDAAFATELVSGTLRMRGAYDPIIDALVNRSLDPGVRDVLRLGSHQILSMRVPAHAAVASKPSTVIVWLCTSLDWRARKIRLSRRRSGSSRRLASRNSAISGRHVSRTVACLPIRG